MVQKSLFKRNLPIQLFVSNFKKMINFAMTNTQ
jgi:hypothetical protein